MGKVKEIFRGPNRRFAWFVVITTTLFVLLWVIGPGNTIGHWIRANQEDKEQQKEIARYKKANEELDRKIENMRDDKGTLEKFAREQYNFAIPGEDVYVIE